MNILEQIFKTENPTQAYPIPNTVYDLLFDWFNESNTSVDYFEKNIFDPAIIAYKTNERDANYFNNYFEEARRSYYLKIAFLYLINYHTDEKLLKRFFQLDAKNNIISPVVNWTTNAKLTSEYPAIFKPLDMGGLLAQYYHAIHARIDINYSYLPLSFAQLKFSTEEGLFDTIFNFVNKQDFVEKTYMLFLLYKSVWDNVEYEYDTSGAYVVKNKETVTTTHYDNQILSAFQKSITDYNQKYGATLLLDCFASLKKFLAYNLLDKRAKVTLSNFEEAKTYLEEAQGNEEATLDHIIYFLEHEWQYKQDKYWEVLLTNLCQSYCPTTTWLDNKALQLLTNNDFKNKELVFTYIITPLLGNIATSLTYTDKLVQDYEHLLYTMISSSPNQKGLAILKGIASRTVNTQEQTFLLQKLSGYYDEQSYLSYSSLIYDEKDKAFTTIKLFIDDLNLLTPIALKKVHKQTYNVDIDESLFTINSGGEDIGIRRGVFAPDINKLLEEKLSPYRLVAIPLLKKASLHYRKDSTFLLSLAFMNRQEHQYFKEQYLMKEENIEKWRGNEEKKLYDGEDFLISALEESTSLNPQFTTDTDKSFATLKLANYSQPASSSEGRNVFLDDINWEWFKNKYIDELNSKEDWYRIMHVVCQCTKEKKPKDKWLAELQEAIQPLGAEKFFKELQVLMSASLKEDAWFFDTYANVLKGLIWCCAYISPNQTSLGILKNITEVSYIKKSGVGPRSTAIGNLALEALINTKMDEAFGMLNIMRNKTKYNRFALILEKSIDKYKEGSTVPEQLLADKSIPDFGFSNGAKRFEASDYNMIISFSDGKLLKQWYNAEGKSVKQIPAEVATALTKDIKEINEEVKQINTVFTDLKKRIRTYWLYNRTWTYFDWCNHIKNHSLIYPHIEGLVWTNTTTGKDFILLNGQCIDIQNNQCNPAIDDVICLWHPVNNTEENINQWQLYLWTSGIVQKERQVFREHYPFSAAELAMTASPRFAHHFIEVKKLMAIANNTGWIFTYEHEGINWPRVYLKPLDITAHLVCDYDRTSDAIPSKDIYITKGNSTKLNDYRTKQEYEKSIFSSIPATTLSEICRDVDLFIATCSIANSPELSQNKQEYRSYRTAYEQGLFSENASGKIRQLIINKIAPTLKLNVEGFDGNYVIVRGITGLYRINMGSGFVQSYDTKKHINLLADTSKLKKNKKLRLPIEDDETLYIIIAKILYLKENSI